MRVLLRVVLLGLMIASLGSVRALADPPGAPDAASRQLARQYVEEGLAAQNAGNYDKAIELYDKAHGLVPHPVLLFNMAQAHRLAGRLERALELYVQYLEHDAGGPQAAVARGWVADLERQRAAAEARQHSAGERKGDRGAVDAGRSDERGAEARRAGERKGDGGAADAGKSGERAAEARRAGERKGDGGAADAGKADARAAGERGTGERGAGGPDLHAAGGDRGAADEVRAAGDLMIRARTSSGAQVAGHVLVDDGRKGDLAGGALAAKLSEGRHSVAIEAGGYRRFEASVAVRAGEQATLDAVLVEAEPPRPAPSMAWHWTLGVSAAVGVSATAFSFYSGSRSRDEAKKVQYSPLSDKDCGRELQFVTDGDRRAFESACTWHGREVTGYAVAGIGVLGAMVATIMLLRDPGPADAATTGAPAPKPAVAVAPIVMPSGGGAAVSLTW